MTTNNAPVYNPNGDWQIWNYKDIYTGPTGLGKFVPKVGDLVNQVVGNVITTYVVTAVAAGSLIPSLVEAQAPYSEGSFTNNDILFGVGSSGASETYRIYIDKSVVPYRLAVDARLTVHGSAVVAAKIFEGSEIGTTGKVISATYDNAGVFLSENANLELVASAAYSNNTAIKVVAPCFTSTNLTDGELVTVVFYDINGFVVSKRQLLVENTGFVRSTDAAARSVVDVSLQSPFLSSQKLNTLEYPINLPVSTANMQGVITYNDGSVVLLPVDGVRFSIAGLDAYDPTFVGQTYPIVLKYVLQEGETAYGVHNAASPHIAREMSLITVASNLNYQVQLNSYPVWVNATQGYRLVHYLTDMNRSRIVDVSSLVTIKDGTVGYNPTNYGAKQALTFTLNLNTVDVVYDSFVVEQTQEFVLQAPGTYRQTPASPPNWYATAIAGRTPYFGNNVFVKFKANLSGGNTLNLKGNFASFTEWLQACYYNALPLFNPATESKAPEPTHFRIVSGPNTATYSIDQWSTDLVVSFGLNNSDTLMVEFYYETTSRRLSLAVAGMPLYQISSTGSYIV